MRSSANLIKAQGVSSCYNEQVRLVSNGLKDKYIFHINSIKRSNIIHYHTINLSYFIRQFFHFHKVSTIAYVHFLPDTIEDSLRIPRLFKKIFYRYILAFYNRMDYLVIVNPSVRKKLIDYGVTYPKIVYIPNFVSTNLFSKLNTENIKQLKKKYKISNNKFVVLGVGQLQTRKGVLDFIETAKRMPDVLFLWAGGFSFGKMSHGYKNIKMSINNAPANIKFLGIIDRSNMFEVYNISDILFLPSFDELFPMAILEAYSCAKPALLRDIDVYHDILFDSYLKANDVDGFVESLNSIIDNKKLYTLYQDKAIECHEHYSSDNILKRWDSLYSEACNKYKKHN
jgi:1,2-diacylglycerol-3-alpha-glucose alpha-1,2-galactosyltransferase